jgi:hypothetical protein
MSILIDEKSKIIIQGFTGDKGTFHAKEMIDYGSNVVGGVTPGKGGSKHLGVPVFNTVKDAVDATGADTSITFVAAGLRADAIMEAADAGIRLRLLDHRRHSGAGHDARQALPAALSEGAAHDDGRPQLRRHHQRRQGDARHHAGPHLQAGQRRHRRRARVRSGTKPPRR